MKNILLLMFLLLGMIACKNDNSNSMSSQKKESTLPALSAEQISEMMDKVTYVDYIFHYLPFSVSQDNKPSIVSNLKYISTEPFELPAGCKPFGREFFHVDGVTMYEADLFFTQGCEGYVFYKDGKPVFSNKISPEGKLFYGNLVKQGEKVKSQNQGNG